MAFKQVAELKGFNRKFSVSPEARPYTLRDNGFVDTKVGNYIYKRPLDSEHKQGLVLKVTVDKDLKGIKISTVNEKGLSTVDISKLDNNAMVVEKVNFIFDGFIDRDVLIEQ
ncbi:cysteine desulfurase [Ruoffia tabacinasalis]|uniref:Cysteine desulfurase n=1 Tax=Ruoffia tabacinasalis TaxID=87458 RepID=A0ABS0LJ40_9LACT|nr:cysteine desulfurase [Ruoffia tabacinasalis]MBG9978278.1 cysteine desulfurase [Ruoffia tabacinasalis]